MLGDGSRNVRNTTTPLTISTGVLVLTGLLLSGCGLLQKTGLIPAPDKPAPAPVPLSEQPYQLNLRLSASYDLNLDTQSRPSPVQVRVFLTDAQSEIGNKSFEQMFDYTGAPIEPSPMSTLTLLPGETRLLTMVSNKAQSMLLIAAAYREPYQSLWKATATITPDDTVSLSATVATNAVTISSQP